MLVTAMVCAGLWCGGGTAAAQDIDWQSDSTLQCAKTHWAEIKNVVDPLLPTAPLILSSDQQTKLNSLLNGAKVMPSKPSDDWLRALPDAVPMELLDQIAGKIIRSCLAES
ncbi:hypothetical protein ACLMAL_34725 [Nocardia sp. CWNU-33]|uniref:hypothetical protein n=1 Tax=Nocardia sp. CWNU-33 TaxID=3392117 RepID=UPI00398F3BA8